MSLSVAKPIFVIGCPRSGNTLIGAILNKHPEAFVLFETNTFSHFYRKWVKVCQQQKQIPPEDYFADLVASGFNKYNEQFSLSFAEINDCAQQGHGDWSLMLDNYMRLLMSRAKPGASRWGDKTPHHLAYMRHIYSIYPKAKFIYTYRDPRAVINSLSQPSFPHASNNRLKNVEVVHYYLSVYEQEKRAVDPSAVYEVRYEDLVADPENIVRGLCDFLEIIYTADMLGAAGNQVRAAIGWPKDKAWDEIKPQPTQAVEGFEPSLEAYLYPWLIKQGYTPHDIRYRRLRKFWVTLRLRPLIVAQGVFGILWQRRYPTFWRPPVLLTR